MTHTKPILCLKHRVSYGETDTMGIMYYAEYFHIFERARNEYIRLSNVSYKEIEAKDILLPVRKASCRYRSPAHYDDLLDVYAIIDNIGRASLHFTYEIKLNEQILVTGETEHACVNRNAKPVAIPSWFREILEKIHKQQKQE